MKKEGFTIKVILHLYNEKGGFLLNLFLVFLLSLFQFNCGILISGIFGFRVTVKRRADGPCTLVVCGNAHERRTCIIVLPARVGVLARSIIGREYKEYFSGNHNTGIHQRSALRNRCPIFVGNSSRR
ncbi:hypothetical protein C5167_011484 [Papaver somniferum]|uniref:Uncharacterized protein n=1 Tax=Papaver somniferum TaxID=3469 RepID=A0A4Y7K724_PAPSO|nr:hypothetical protein C5167_011484 [Papaver somniferum]